MAIWNKSEAETPETDETFVRYSDLTGTPPNPEENESVDLKNYKKKGFHDALRGEKLQPLLEEINTICKTRVDKSTTILKAKLYTINEQLEELAKKIAETTSRLSNEEALKQELKEEKLKLEEKLYYLEHTFSDLVTQLGEAEKNLIKDRLDGAKQELSELVEMYNSIFEQKLGDEATLKQSIDDHRSTCKDLINSNKETLNKVNHTLNAVYKFGGGVFSANLLFLFGLLAAFTTGWFFTIFSTSNELVNQNGLFFSLSNLFNYLSVFIIEFGPFDAGKFMTIYFIVILVIISALILLSDIVVYQFSGDQSDFQFSVQINHNKTKFIKLGLRPDSSLSVWFKFLPWLFIAGLFIIMLSVGQFNGSEDDQIKFFSYRLSGQVTGGVLALLFSGLYFLFITQYVEPGKEEKKENSTEKRTKRPLFYPVLIIAGNLFLGILLYSQTVEAFGHDKTNLLAIIAFVLCVNLTAFVLSYAIRQKGLLKTKKDTEKRIYYFNKLLTALSGSKPINTWIAEERQFQKHFLKIQRQLFHLIHTKNQLANRLRKQKKQHSFATENQPQSKGFFKWLNFWPRKEINFYRQNFPELSFRLRETRKKINNTGKELESVNEKLTAHNEGHSTFQNLIKDELRQLNRNKNKWEKEKVAVIAQNETRVEQLEKERDDAKQAVIEGHGLGKWTTTKLNAAV